MKILMATMGLDIGGAETHIVELAKELKAEGHDIVVASNGGVYVPEIVAAGIRHYQVPMHRRDAGCMLRSRKLLKEIIRTERPDVVHAHARIPAFLCGTLQRTMKFPFVTTAHWVFTTKGGLRYLTNWGQRTVAVSDDIKAYLIREYGVPEEHISVTINGIDTEQFSPAVSGVSGGGVRPGPVQAGGLLCEPDGRGPGPGGPAADPDRGGAGPGGARGAAAHRRRGQRVPGAERAGGGMN